MGVVGFASVEDFRCMIHGPTQPSQQKPGIREGIFQERSVGDSYLNDVSLCDIQRRTIKPWRMLYHRNTASLNWKEQRQGNEGRLLDSQNSAGRK